MPPGALPGFRDFYPTELAERAHLFAAWREIAHRFGFVEYDGPPLEPLDLYTRKSGEEIVAQLYAFTDKGGREVALRPEMTPTLARMVAARANALRKPVRWFSIPQLFRYERQQRGRLREHFQLNMDILGEADVTADAELLAAAIGIMRELGLTKDDVVAFVSDRRLLEAILTSPAYGVPREHLSSVFVIVDKIGRERRDVLEKRLLELGLDTGTSDRLFALLGEPIKNFDDFGAWAKACGCEEKFEALRRYLDCLTDLGVREWVKPNQLLVRGLAYYTGIVFELFDAKREFRAICGGGRYDNLLSSLGGVELPAVGFGMGDVVLGEVLRERGLLAAPPPALDVWVAFADDESVARAREAASQLRARGRRVEYALAGQKLARQLKAAHAAGARHTLVLAAADAARGEAVVRDMDAGTEQRVTLAAWIDSR
jgi:histidyl-tRNA synthetase